MNYKSIKQVGGKNYQRLNFINKKVKLLILAYNLNKLANKAMAHQVAPHARTMDSKESY